MMNKRRQWQSTFITYEASIWLERAVPNGRWTKDSMEIEESHDRSDRNDLTVGPKVHLWGRISARGAAKLSIFSSNMDSKRMLRSLDLLKNRWRSSILNDLSFNKMVILAIDQNSPRSFLLRILTHFCLGRPIALIFHLLKIFGGWLKGEVSKDRPATVDAMKRSLKRHWAKLTPEFLAPYFNSMPQRMNMIIESEGDRISY